MRHRVNPGATPVSGSGRKLLAEAFSLRALGGRSRVFLLGSPGFVSRSADSVPFGRALVGAGLLLTGTLSGCMPGRLPGNGGSNQRSLTTPWILTFGAPCEWESNPTIARPGLHALRRCCWAHVASLLRPEIGRDHPLNLSISLRGGKETNKDSLSNGE